MLCVGVEVGGYMYTWQFCLVAPKAWLSFVLVRSWELWDGVKQSIKTINSSEEILYILSQGSDATPSKLSNGTSGQGHVQAPGSVVVSQRIHSITQKYITNTNYLITANTRWDQGDERITSDIKGKYCWNYYCKTGFNGDIVMFMLICQPAVSQIQILRKMYNLAYICWCIQQWCELLHEVLQNWNVASFMTQKLESLQYSVWSTGLFAMEFVLFDHWSLRNEVGNKYAGIIHCTAIFGSL